MRKMNIIVQLVALALVWPAPARADLDVAGGGRFRPICLHPENPHYFLFRGKPTLIITSGEHYGALLNLDFNYAAYFEELEANGLNSTRTFSGAYVETAGNFNIARNTLDPAPGRFICPWPRSDVPGYADGGNKFDLDRWDEGYFRRLRDFVAEAGRRGVIVEMNLFCPFYDDSQWGVSPMNARNNLNGLGKVPRTDVYTLDQGGGLLSVQEAMVRRIVAELRDFDNVYYEICNEPYFGGVTMEWQHRIADVITEAQKDFPHKFLISQNIANGSKRVEKPHPSVSIFNFHYATPPDAVALNYDLGKVIGDNETGFRGTMDAPYRMEAWDFIIAGGGLFNHLDYSFTADHPRGTWVDYPPSQPGGGSPALRRQFRLLRDFMHGFDFIRMRPHNSVIQGGAPPGGTARALVDPGKAYAIYLRGEGSTGPYSVRWSGFVEPRRSEEHTFHTFSNDGVRLWVEGKLLIDNWTDHSETEDAGRVALEAGRRYPLKLEYFYGGGQGAIKLWWSSPSQKKEPVPTSQLHLPDLSGPGLRGEYFKSKTFERPWRSRTDANVDYAWGTESPFSEPRAVGGSTLALELLPGPYEAEWVDTRSGALARGEVFQHGGGTRRLPMPAFKEDIALRVKRRAPLNYRFPLSASADSRHLVDQDGRPFFYHADTAWNLAKKLTLAEAAEYFDDRRARGFTAIHLQAVSKEQGPMANRDRQDPFQPADDILKPNEPYWKHLDQVLEAASERGLLVALAPLWIRWGGDDPHGWRHQLGEANARPYGEFLGKRYRRFANLVWILGGDANPGEKAQAIRELAAGLRQAAPHHLLTYHAAPDNSSASLFPHDAWLDINMAYTYREVHLHVLPEYRRAPVRPIVLGESGYEEESNDGRGGSVQRVRRQAYRAVLSGALGGHAFGQKHVWRCDGGWRGALDSPGSRQMAHVASLFGLRPWYRLVPDSGAECLVDGRGASDDDRAIAARAADGSLLIAYLPSPRSVRVNMARLARPLRASWFDPTDGSRLDVEGAPFANAGTREFTPPVKNAGGDGDFVLVLECDKSE